MAHWSPAGGSTGGPDRPREHSGYRGVARVRQPDRPAFTDTADVPVVGEPTPTPTDRRAAGRSAAPPGMVVRRRWRALRAGAGWSWTGLTVVLVCWGVWAISVRGTEMLGPVLGLGLVLATGVLMFVVARLLGRAVFERALGRERPSAWPSHLTVCAFWTLAGLTFLQQTWWVRDGWRWLTDL